MPLSSPVREVYVPLAEYPHVGEDARLRDAFVSLREGLTSGRRYRHVLVLNDRRELVGILGMRDILRGLFPDFLRSEALGHHVQGPVPDFPSLTLIWAETSQQQCQAAARRPVREFMGPVPARVGVEDPIAKAPI